VKWKKWLCLQQKVEKGRAGREESGDLVIARDRVIGLRPSADATAHREEQCRTSQEIGENNSCR
jgi:hypothetical protein